MSASVLKIFSRQHKQQFPLKARVCHVEEASTVLQRQGIKVGSEVVLHGWVRQAKVLALGVFEKVGDGEGVNNGEIVQHYGIPLTYQGLFRVTSKFFVGVCGLIEGGVGGWVEVVRVDAQEDCCMAVGDVVKVIEEKNEVVKMVRKEDGEVLTVRRRFQGVFKESVKTMNGYRTPPQNVKELSALLNDCELEVEVAERSEDCSGNTSLEHTMSLSNMDLPASRLLFTALVTEQSILASDNSATNPIFQIPLRTRVYLEMLTELGKNEGPFGRDAGKKDKPVFSTLDRCVELISPDVFASMRLPHGKVESLNYWISNSLKENTEKKSTSMAVNAKVLKEIPLHGNLYAFKGEEFMALLSCLRLDVEVMERCCRLEIDGKKFARLSMEDLAMLDLKHPVLRHFKKRTCDVK